MRDIMNVLMTREGSALKELLNNLRHKDKKRRYAYAFTLKWKFQSGEIRTEDAYLYENEILRLLNDSEEELRKIGCRILGFLQDEKSMNRLIAIIKEDKSPQVRIEAIQSVPRTRVQGIFPELLAIAGNNQDDNRLRKCAVLEVLPAFKEQSVGFVKEMCSQQGRWDISLFKPAELKPLLHLPQAKDIALIFLEKLNNEESSPFIKEEILYALEGSPFLEVKQVLCGMAQKKETIDVKLSLVKTLHSMGLKQEGKDTLISELRSLCASEKYPYYNSNKLHEVMQLYFEDVLEAWTTEFWYTPLFYNIFAGFLSYLDTFKVGHILNYLADDIIPFSKRERLVWLLIKTGFERAVVPEAKNTANEILRSFMDIQFLTEAEKLASQDEKKQKEAISLLRMMALCGYECFYENLLKNRSGSVDYAEYLKSTTDLFQKVAPERFRESATLLKIVERLTSVLKNQEETVCERTRCLDALRAIGGEKSLEALVEALGDDRLKEHAIKLLSSLGREASFILTENMDNIQNKEAAKDVLKKIYESGKEKAFSFDDILKMDERFLQLSLREVNMADLAIALKGADENIKKKVFSCMSKRAAERMQEDLQFLGPVWKSRIMEAKQRIVDIILRLEQCGEIVLPREGDEVVF